MDDDFNKDALEVIKLYKLTFKYRSRFHVIRAVANDVESAIEAVRKHHHTRELDKAFFENAKCMDAVVISRIEVS